MDVKLARKIDPTLTLPIFSKWRGEKRPAVDCVLGRETGTIGEKDRRDQRREWEKYEAIFDFMT